MQDKTVAGEGPAKPTLYFLKGNHGGDEAAAASAPAPVFEPAERRRRRW